MPISVDIRANGNHLFSLHIARMTENAGVNTYSAVHSMDPWQESRIGDTEWADGAQFEHRAGDGIEALVRRALEALDKADG